MKKIIFILICCLNSTLLFANEPCDGTNFDFFTGDNCNTNQTASGTTNLSFTCGSPENTVWTYIYVPASGAITINTFGSDYDTQLEVFTSSDNTCSGTLTSVGCNDDAGAGLQSEVVLTGLTPGDILYVAIDGFAGESGTLVVGSDVTPTCPVLDFAAPIGVCSGGTINLTVGGACSMLNGEGNHGRYVDWYYYSDGVGYEAPAGYFTTITAPSEYPDPNGDGLLVNEGFDQLCGDFTFMTTWDNNTCSPQVVTIYALVFSYNYDTDCDLTAEYPVECTPVRFDVTIYPAQPTEEVSTVFAGCDGAATLVWGYDTDGDGSLFTGLEDPALPGYPELDPDDNICDIQDAFATFVSCDVDGETASTVPVTAADIAASTGGDITCYTDLTLTATSTCPGNGITGTHSTTDVCSGSDIVFTDNADCVNSGDGSGFEVYAYTTDGGTTFGSNPTYDPFTAGDPFVDPNLVFITFGACGDLTIAGGITNETCSPITITFFITKYNATTGVGDPACGAESFEVTIYPAPFTAVPTLGSCATATAPSVEILAADGVSVCGTDAGTAPTATPACGPATAAVDLAYTFDFFVGTVCEQNFAGTVANETCPDGLTIEAVVSNVTCDDMGTADPNDDEFSYDLTVNALTGTGTTWTDGTLVGQTYGTPVTITGNLITAGNISISVSDETAGCTATATATAPASCSVAAACTLTASGVAGVSCNDNATPADPTDDYVSFSLSPTGSNLGASYTVTGGTGLLNDGTLNYGAPENFDLPVSGNAFPVTLTITDVSTDCTFDVIISNPCVPCNANAGTFPGN